MGQKILPSILQALKTDQYFLENDHVVILKVQHPVNFLICMLSLFFIQKQEKTDVQFQELRKTVPCVTVFTNVLSYYMETKKVKSIFFYWRSQKTIVDKSEDKKFDWDIRFRNNISETMVKATFGEKRPPMSIFL